MTGWTPLRDYDDVVAAFKARAEWEIDRRGRPRRMSKIQLESERWWFERWRPYRLSKEPEFICWELGQDGAVVGYWCGTPRGKYRYLREYERTELMRCIHCGLVAGPKLVRERLVPFKIVDRHNKKNFHETARDHVACNRCHRRECRRERRLDRYVVQACETWKLLDQLSKEVTNVRKAA